MRSSSRCKRPYIIFQEKNRETNHRIFHFVIGFSTRAKLPSSLFASFVGSARKRRYILLGRDRVAQSSLLVTTVGLAVPSTPASVIIRDEKRQRKREEQHESPIYIKNGKMQNQIRSVGRAGRSPRELETGWDMDLASQVASLPDTSETDLIRRLVNATCSNH